MASKIDIMIGLLVLLAGLLIYPGPIGTIYLGGVSGVVFGAVGLALRKRMSRIGLGVSIFAIILGIVAVLVAPGGLHLVPTPEERQFAMEAVGVLTMATGVLGVVAGARAIAKSGRA